MTIQPPSGPQTVTFVVNYLRLVRVCARLTQKEVAFRMGVPAGRVSSYEGRRRMPPADQLFNWAAVLGFPLVIDIRSTQPSAGSQS